MIDETRRMIQSTPDLLILLIIIFCFWRGILAIKSKKFITRFRYNFFDPTISEGLFAQICGVLLVLFGLWLTIGLLSRYYF